MSLPDSQAVETTEHVFSSAPLAIWVGYGAANWERPTGAAEAKPRLS